VVSVVEYSKSNTYLYNVEISNFKEFVTQIQSCVYKKIIIYCNKIDIMLTSNLVRTKMTSCDYNGTKRDGKAKHGIKLHLT